MLARCLGVESPPLTELPSGVKILFFIGFNFDFMKERIPGLPEPLTEVQMLEAQIRALEAQRDRRPSKGMVVAVALLAMGVSAVATKVLSGFSDKASCVSEGIEKNELAEKIKAKEASIKDLLMRMIGTPLGDKFSVKLNRETSYLSARITGNSEILEVELNDNVYFDMDNDGKKDLSETQGFSVNALTKDPKFVIRSIMDFDEGLKGRDTRSVMLMGDPKDANSYKLSGTKSFQRDEQFLEKLEGVEAALKGESN